ncbi:MAG: tryptophan 2,3-dioxygenase [Bacteroidia bacterium]|nr:tryptophan 2,3-dioxygenase [Bacteroidia bacterium]MCF8427967.1 tryptophan 2,3-dioxygenase [Bacteroidia bacterium]MCF8446321.1 tryptophan 2,3-dioxygenase [Bacteroidia bacterium]
MENLLNQLKTKLQASGQDPENYLKGLQHNRAINYWEYVQVDTLLSLQNPRTNFKDETIFIVYHQITELVLGLIKHELEQLCNDDLSTELFTEKINRMIRYTDLLISSFSIMNKGMSYEDYNQFRLSLSPASGFQSAQFRFIELMCTDIDLLIHPHFRKNLKEDSTLKEKFSFVYWQEAGYNREADTKTKTLSDFEKKYLDSFIALAEKMKVNNLRQKYQNHLVQTEPNLKEELLKSLRAFDVKYNIEWPMVHLETARTYLKAKGETKTATGGSSWEKYLHPEFQRRIYFPELWSEEEMANWGKE